MQNIAQKQATENSGKLRGGLFYLFLPCTQHCNLWWRLGFTYGLHAGRIILVYGPESCRNMWAAQPKGWPVLYGL